MPSLTLAERLFFFEMCDFTAPWQPGEVVLFHHGYARSNAFWYEWVPLVARRYRTLRFDMLGHGRSGPLPAGFEPTLESLADDTVRLLDALDIDQVHFVGESLAGVVGIWLGAYHADRIRSLVLLSTPVKVSAEGRADFSAGAPSWAEAFDRLSPAQWAERTMAHRFDPAATDPAYIEWAIAQAAATPVDSLRKYARLIETLDLTGGIPRVEVPSLLIAGGSKLAPPEQARFLHEQIPGSRLELVPQARHLVGYAMAERCATLAMQFWRGATR